MKTKKVTFRGEYVIGTYVGSEKAFDRAVSMYNFQKPKDLDEAITLWEQLADDYGLQFRKLEDLDLS